MQAPFTNKKGAIDDHHPAYYFNALAKAAGDDEQVKFWENRIARKMRHPKYANVVVEPEVKDNGKKSKVALYHEIMI